MLLGVEENDELMIMLVLFRMGEDGELIINYGGGRVLMLILSMDEDVDVYYLWQREEGVGAGRGLRRQCRLGGECWSRRECQAPSKPCKQYSTYTVEVFLAVSSTYNTQFNVKTLDQCNLEAVHNGDAVQPRCSETRCSATK